jgi:hypothetical protein
LVHGTQIQPPKGAISSANYSQHVKVIAETDSEVVCNEEATITTFCAALHNLGAALEFVNFLREASLIYTKAVEVCKNHLPKKLSLRQQLIDAESAVAAKANKVSEQMFIKSVLLSQRRSHNQDQLESHQSIKILSNPRDPERLVAPWF